MKSGFVNGAEVSAEEIGSSGYRFSFNGKEHDDEVKGTGNEIDFGERMDDPRLARFLSIDPLSRNFPGESNYCFAGDNPILFVDKKGQYKFAENTAEKYTKTYPTLTKYLSENICQDVTNSPNIMQGLLKYSNGNLNENEVNRAVSWGSGPIIKIVDEPGINGDQWMAAKGASGWYDPINNTIEISTNLAKQLEAATSKEDKQAALFSLFVTLTHETVHYGDYLDGRRQEGEPGNAFEWNVFDSKLVDEGNGKKTPVPQGHNSSDINDAKKMIQLNKDQGKSDVIPTVPATSSKDDDNSKSKEKY